MSLSKLIFRHPMNATATIGACAISRMRTFLSVIAFFTLQTALSAQAPAWWGSRGVTTGAPPNDYAVANQGQLKWIAKQAMIELDAALASSGGAGTGVHGLVDPWATPASATADYSAVNLGQLKVVAKPFYDTLIAAGYATSYPWSGAANDYAAANLGQVKNLFSFDIASWTVLVASKSDANGDGLPDWWQIVIFGRNFANISNTAAYSFYNGNTVANYQNANPVTNAGLLTISITYPSSGSTF